MKILVCDVPSLWDVCKIKYGKGSRINFSHLVEAVDVDQYFAYILVHPTNKTHVSFSTSLTNMGYGVTAQSVEFVERITGTFRNNVSPQIIVDLIETYTLYDEVILATGDNDYNPLYTYLQGKGKKVVAASFDTPVTRRLHKDADGFIPLPRAAAFKQT